MKNFFHRLRYIDGTYHRHVARKNRWTGDMEFVLWPKGHENLSGYTYEEDFWHPIPSGRENEFIPNEN